MKFPFHVLLSTCTSFGSYNENMIFAILQGPKLIIGHWNM